MKKEIIIFKENGFYSSELLPKDINGDLLKYKYIEDILKGLLMFISENKKKVLK